MKIDFTVAKKFSRNTVKGLELRSASVDRAVVFNTSGKGYEAVRNAAEAFAEINKAEGHDTDLRLKGVGKSYEITGSDTLRFLRELNFVNESHNEFIDFYNKEIDKIGEVTGLELGEKAALVQMCAEGESFEEFFDKLLPIIEKYDIGIFKK